MSSKSLKRLKRGVACLTVSAVFAVAFIAEAQINIAMRANVSVLTVSTHKKKPSFTSTDGNRLELSELMLESSDIIAEFDSEYVLHYVIVYGNIQSG